MRYRIAAALVCAALLGCALSESAIVDPEARKRKYPEQPLQIIEKKTDGQEAAAPADPAVQRIMDEIKKQQEALAQPAQQPAQQRPRPPLHSRRLSRRRSLSSHRRGRQSGKPPLPFRRSRAVTSSRSSRSSIS